MMLADRIIFEDGEALVIDKPPDGGASRSLDAAQPGGSPHELRLGFRRAPTLVHRLDRDTSGCLLLARNPKAHKRFAAEFEAGRVEKTYLAILDGIPPAEEGVVELALSKVSSREAGWRMVPDEKGQRAVTHWRLVGRANGRAMVRFAPETGRTHQLRVHAASGIGVPIVGDPVYGRPSPFQMLLHASSLRLQRGEKPPVEASAPLPLSFANAGFTDAGL
jgi:tRNA pseudouridine32 synthase/23S rRNA pseudouridine746 synthase